ncbi:fdxN element excision recombinase XisF [Rivularia sp. UHCC 0363]|uniref:fdxN element excision recombinase XisF n=1 Tax=Rivularia sp. UHCC 0363 TaxID=3110244 RepID=UPI002B2198C4|nr:fdxN element excision recombinase XisF [Rivularia sp. UHCC 0363]MEA5593190.1 fdxN element excision recombinase XisF [Rivularia sp. UHCC 0363]
MRIGYARVSTRQQADTEALDQQISRLEKAGAQKILYDIESGRKDTRKDFNQIIVLAKNGVATEIIVTRLDRLGRNVISIHKTLEILHKTGVKLTILDSPLGDTNSAFGWLTINNIAGLAEFESRLLSERISHGTDYYRSNLKYFGKPPFGYTKDVDGKCIPHTTKWLIAKEIIAKLYTNSYSSISRWLAESFETKMYPSSLRNWLHNPALRGHTFYKLKSGEIERHYGTHQALISEQDYEDLSKITAHVNKKDPAKFKPHILAGIFKCGVCGHAMTKTKAALQFQCVQYKKFGKAGCSNGKTIAKSIVKTEVAKVLIRYASEVVREVNHRTQTDIAVDKTLITLQHQLQTLQSLSSNPAINLAIADLKQQIKNYQQQNNTRESKTEDDYLMLRSFAQADFWELLSDTEFKVICLRFLETVVFNGERDIEICLREISVP